MHGFVYIAGAGVGDPDLLTIKTHRLIVDWADVVVYDRLIADSIIAIIPSNVEVIYAGKSCRKHVLTQDEINNVLLQQARAGKKVLRLKGGDPFIFGRGGEEMQFLQGHDIPCSVVPGISAASAISAHLGIPLTHRGIANSVQFITGHKQKDMVLDVNWQSLSDKNTTIVIYMGLTNLSFITSRLIESGLNGQTPAIAVHDGLSSKQKICNSVLSFIAADVEKEKMQSPVLVIIGNVVDLAKSA